MSLAMCWEDPPKLTGKQAVMEHNRLVFEQLQSHAGRWAKVGSRVATGSANTWLRWGCEVRRITVGPGRVDVWARWVEPGVAS